jgi:hypothetical protein
VRLRQQKITLGECGPTAAPYPAAIYCGDYKCAHLIEIDSFHWPDEVRLSDLEPKLPVGFAAIAALMSGRCLRNIVIRNIQRRRGQAEVSSPVG